MLTRLCFAFIAVCGMTTAVDAQGFPWKKGDKPPPLAGFKLYDTVAAVLPRLGEPVRVDTLGRGADAALVYTNERRGVSLVTSRLDGVAIIYVTDRGAGAIDSIRVGDTSERVLARWGKPHQVGGSNALWIVDDWIVVVQLGPGNVVVRIGVGREG